LQRITSPLQFTLGLAGQDAGRVAESTGKMQDSRGGGGQGIGFAEEIAMPNALQCVESHANA
jgi:hypothetical protein